MRVIKGNFHQPLEVKGSSIFYAFSYYYDRAVESGLIGEFTHTACRAPVPGGPAVRADGICRCVETGF